MADGEVKVIITDDGSSAQTAAEIGKTSGAINDLGGETKKTGEAAEGMNIHSRETRLLFTEINKIAPGLGHALHAAFAGPLGGILLVALAVAEVKEKLKEYNNALDDAGDKAAQPLTDGVNNLRDAWDDAKKHLGDYLAKYDEAGKDKDPVSTMVKQEKEIADARIVGIKKQIEALEKLEEMQIRTGSGNREQKEKELASARESSQNAIDALEGGKSVADLQRELATRNANQQELAMAFDAAKNAAVAPTARAKDQDVELANLREANAPGAKSGTSKTGLKSQGDVDAAQKKVDELSVLQVGSEVSPDEIDEANAKLVEKTTALANQRNRQAQIEAGETEVSRQKAAADEVLKNTGDALLKNKTRLGQLLGEISTAQAVQSAEAGIPGLGDAVEKVFGADQAVASGQKLNTNQSAAIVALREMLDQANENSSAFLELILAGAKKHKTLAQTVADLQKQIGTKY